MASSMTQIRKALADTVSQLGLQAYPRIPQAIDAPAVVVEPSPKPITIDYQTSMGVGSGAQYHFNLVVLASVADLDSGQDVLDGYLAASGPSSLAEFIFRNPRLGLPDVFARAVTASGYGQAIVAGLTYISATVRVVVTVS